MVQPQLHLVFQLQADVFGIEDGAQNGQDDGAGHAEQRGIEGHAHAGQGREQTTAHVVQGVLPVGGAAQQLGKGGYGKAQAQEGAQQTQGDKQRHRVVQKPLTQQVKAQIGVDGRVDDGGGIGFRAEGFIGGGEIFQSVVHHPAFIGVTGLGQLGLTAVSAADGKEHGDGKGKQCQDQQDHKDADGVHIR